jgi:hypothetical protein
MNNACIVSYYMENVDDRTVEYQKAVVNKFNKSNLPFYQVKANIRHGFFMDYFWKMNGVDVVSMSGQNIMQQLDHDVVLFLDIDCIPLNENAIDYYVQEASSGSLIGNAQRSNHIENDQHVFAAPSALAISKQNFVKIESPSAIETGRSDVAEEYTWKAEELGVQVKLCYPLKYDAPPIRMAWEKDTEPYWALADGMPVYGIGTTFGNSDLGELFWHNFQIFQPGQQERFWTKCEEVLEGE